MRKRISLGRVMSDIFSREYFRMDGDDGDGGDGGDMVFREGPGDLRE